MIAQEDSPLNVPKAIKVFTGKFRTVVRVIYKNLHYEFLQSHDSVKVLAVRPDDSIALVKQARPAIKRSTIEIPGGAIEQGEEPLDAAKRELKEETGVTASRWDELLLPTANSPGQSTERSYLFLARNLEVGPPEREASEQGMEHYWLPAEEYEQGFVSGIYDDLVSYAAVVTYLRNIGKFQS